MNKDSRQTCACVRRAALGPVRADAGASGRTALPAGAPRGAGRRLRDSFSEPYRMESLILAQDKRWRRALCMQVAREPGFGRRTAANG